MELTRPSYAVVYVILLCALAQGGSEGKGGKEEEISRDGGSASSIYVYRTKVLCFSISFNMCPLLFIFWNFLSGFLFAHDSSFYSE